MFSCIILCFLFGSFKLIIDLFGIIFIICIEIVDIVWVKFFDSFEILFIFILGVKLSLNWVIIGFGNMLIIVVLMLKLVSFFFIKWEIFLIFFGVSGFLCLLVCLSKLKDGIGGKLGFNLFVFVFMGLVFSVVGVNVWLVFWFVFWVLIICDCSVFVFGLLFLIDGVLLFVEVIGLFLVL